MPAPSYRERLRIEGAVLAGAGATGSFLLLVLADGATDGPAGTIGQLAVVAALLGWFGPRAAKRWMAGSKALPDASGISGDPTPLWQHPLIVAGLTALIALPPEVVSNSGPAWDAGLRVTGGCVLVGLAQMVLLERVVAADEDRHDRRYVRLPGSSLRGTKLGFTRPSSSPESSGQRGASTW